jgi:hypothetical protein
MEIIASQLVKKSPAFYGTRKFITVFAKAHHWPLSWARIIQSTISQLTCPRSILILSSHLRLDLPSGLFSSNFVSISRSFHAYYTTCPSHIPWFHWWSVQVSSRVHGTSDRIGGCGSSVLSSHSLVCNNCMCTLPVYKRTGEGDGIKHLWAE